jgi:hypothetical protein
MHAIYGCLAALIVAGLYYGWRAWWHQRVRNLRNRVAYMLWVAAQQEELSGVIRRTGPVRKIDTI